MKEKINISVCLDKGYVAVDVVMDTCDGDIVRYNSLRYSYKKGYFNSGWPRRFP
jgi:hypothetical protein